MTYPSPMSYQSPRGKKRHASTPPTITSQRSDPSTKRLKRAENASSTPGSSAHKTPCRRGRSLLARDGLGRAIHTSGSRNAPDPLERMEEEKKRFPGSANWAEDELRLYKVLFLREHQPLLPHNWEVDFRGIPMPRGLFARSDFFQPVVYSCSGNNFKATRALTRLIELSSTVRTLMQAGQSDKVPYTICKELDDFAKWAAQDGGYYNLREIVPNLIIDQVDVGMGSTKIEEYMRARMKTLAAAHRDYWRIDRLAPNKTWDLPLVSKRVGSIEVKTKEIDSNVANTAPVQTPGQDTDSPTIKMEPSEQKAPMEFRYTQRPPVLYGIFAVHHSALVLTIDSAKEEDDAYISYQVRAGFNDKFQAVWNAVTMAIVICKARDHMITMADDFIQLVQDPESDPDA